jgi:hypothetical protein
MSEVRNIKDIEKLRELFDKIIVAENLDEVRRLLP